MELSNIIQKVKKINYVLCIRAIIIYSAAFIMVIPFLWMISTSFKNNEKIFDFPVSWIPDPINLEGYKAIIKNRIIGSSFSVFYLNSIKVTVISLVGTFFSCTMAAYAYAKINFKGRDAIFIAKVSLMMIPFQIIILPLFFVYRKLGLVDTHAALWLPLFMGTSFGVFLLRQYFMGLSDELCEATRIDGGGHWRIYWSIILPLSKPAITVLLIFTFVGIWNDYESPLYFLRTTELYTIPIALKALQSNIDLVNYTAIMAGTTISLIPIFIIFIFGQRYFVAGITFTGLKG